MALFMGAEGREWAYELRWFWCHFDGKMWRTIELVDGLRLKFWWILSAFGKGGYVTAKIAWNWLKWSVFVENCDDDSDWWLGVRVRWSEIFLLLLDSCCFEAIERRRMCGSWRLSFVDGNGGELSRNCCRCVGNCWGLIWRWKFDGSRERKLRFHYGRSNFGSDLSGFGWFCVLLLWVAQKMSG